MKQIAMLCASIILLVSSTIFGQVPKKISYQGLLTNTALKPLADGDYNVEFRIYNDQNSSQILWNEKQRLSIQNGVFNVILGEVNPLTLKFDQNYWLGVKVENESEMTPRIPMVSVPYSFYSGLSEGLAEDATGAVLSINGLEGDIELEGDNGVTVSKSGNRLLISNSIKAIDKIISSKAPF